MDSQIQPLLTLQFDKIKFGNISSFSCRDGGWQLNKEFGFYRCSSARDLRTMEL